MPADTSRHPLIRAAHPNDHDAIVALALRAWETVYASVNGVLGPELALALHARTGATTRRASRANASRMSRRAPGWRRPAARRPAS